MEKFYFIQPPATTHLTEHTKENLKWRINRDNPSKKIQDLFKKIDDLVDEMQHQEWLRRKIGFIDPNNVSRNSVFHLSH